MKMIRVTITQAVNGFIVCVDTDDYVSYIAKNVDTVGDIVKKLINDKINKLK